METVTRRAMIVASAGLAALTSTAMAKSKSLQPAGFSFPQGFLWGAASAGHQVEGNNVNADIWLLEHAKPTVFVESSGDACDSFNRWGQDMDLVKALGLNTYRFSLEWARIEPAEGEISRVMLEHYKRMISGCRERGLTPMVTFNHFTVPRWFAAKGGWEAAMSADSFTRYCETAAKALAADMAYATTLNEPNLTRILKWLVLPFPPSMMETQSEMLKSAAKACGTDKFSSAIAGDADAMLGNMIAGHKAGYAAIKAVRPDLPVGVSLSITDDQSVGKNSRRDAKRSDVYGAWMEAAKTGDFIGVQNYGRQRIDSKGPMPAPVGAELTQMGEEFFPESLEGAVRYAHEATGLPVIVTENGIATTDDARRVAYIPRAVASLGNAMKNGVPVLGYVHWCLLDNFEWLFGYRPRYGLVAVNRETQERTPKPSAQMLGGIALQNKV
jgi:beta-glucosidase